MSPSFLENVLRGAEALAARDPVGLLPDAELLKRFTADRDASAFAVLVRRHGPLVWGVCRNLLLEDGEAEDAFQATFLALVKSASSVNRPEALGGWLHGVAYRVAMKARRSAARRKRRESVAAALEENNPVADRAWDELQAAVHEEVCRLPEKLRLPFVLVGLQGRPQKEAAKQLGWTVGTFSARLCQARQRLLDRLAKRNMPIVMAASAAMIGAVSASAAVPNALVMKALNVVAAPDAVTPFVISLSRGVTQMYLTRTKMLVAGVLLAGILTTGIGARLMSNAEAQSPEVIAEVDRKLEALREQQANGKWEYKFVPLEKPLPAKELQRVLASHDREGWDYCGSQDVVVKGQPVPHLTFKRPNKAFTPTTEREQYLLEALKTYEEALKLDPKKGAKKPPRSNPFPNQDPAPGSPGAVLFNSEWAKEITSLQKDQAGLGQAIANLSRNIEGLPQEARKQREQELNKARVELQKVTAQLKIYADAYKCDLDRPGYYTAPVPNALIAEAEARQRVELELKRAVEAEARVRAQAAEADAAKAATLSERDRAAQLQKQLEVLKAEHAAMLKLLEEKKKAGGSEKKPVESETQVIPLKHTTARDTYRNLLIQKVPLELKEAVTWDSRTNSIIINGSADKIAEVKKLIASLDVVMISPPLGNPETILVNLKNITQKEAITLLVPRPD